MNCELVLLRLRAAVLGTSASEKKAERDPRSDRGLDLLLAGASPKEGSEICRAWLKAYDAVAAWASDAPAKRIISAYDCAHARAMAARYYAKVASAVAAGAVAPSEPTNPDFFKNSALTEAARVATAAAAAEVAAKGKL